MADPRFFKRAGPFTLGGLASTSEAQLLDPGQAERLISDVAPLETAGPDDLTFLDNRKYLEAFIQSRAGAAFVQEADVPRAPSGMALLVTPQPYKAFARAAQRFYAEPPTAQGRAPSAIIDAGANVPGDCTIGPYVVI